MTVRARAFAGLASAVLVSALLGCSAQVSGGPLETPLSSAAHGTIVVDAAASLTESFQRIADEFHAANPGITVTFNFGGSSALAAQIVSGAPADVFASANPATMATVTDAAAASAHPLVFARNRLEIAVPASNPGHITGLADLADPAKTIALCAPEVPCGAAAATVFRKAGLVAAPDTLEQDVKAALTKVRLGEVDAALVYRTDVDAAGDRVTGIPFPESSGAINEYLIAPLKGSSHQKLAAAFIAWVRGDSGQKVLKEASFDLP